eukprot:Gb_19287 [translate_table: standard]
MKKLQCSFKIFFKRTVIIPGQFLTGLCSNVGAFYLSIASCAALATASSSSLRFFSASTTSLSKRSSSAYLWALATPADIEMKGAFSSSQLEHNSPVPHPSALKECSVINYACAAWDSYVVQGKWSMILYVPFILSPGAMAIIDFFLSQFQACFHTDLLCSRCAKNKYFSS